MKPRIDTPAADPTAVQTAPAVTEKTPETPKAEPEDKVWLTSRSSKEFGGRGRFVTATETDAAAAPKGLLTEPTAEQLAQRS